MKRLIAIRHLTCCLLYTSDTAYTVEICVTFQNLRQGCTTDPGWSTGTNLAFYYVPNPQLGSQTLANLEQSILAGIGEDTPEALYAQAVLLSQPSDEGLGFNAEAIDLLNRLLTEYPDSPLVQSSDVFLRLGNLYREVELPLSAARAFQQATQRSPACTETAAQAYLGLSLTTPNASTVTDLLDQALDHYHCLLNQVAFAEKYSEICGLVGDICIDLRPLQEFEGVG